MKSERIDLNEKKADSKSRVINPLKLREIMFRLP